MNRQIAASARRLSRFTVCPVSVLLMVSACLLSGCGDAQAPWADVYATYEPADTWDDSDNTEAAPIGVIRVAAEQPLRPEWADQAAEAPTEESISNYWSFPTEGAKSSPRPLTPTPLPAIGDAHDQQHHEESSEELFVENNDSGLSRVQPQAVSLEDLPPEVVENQFVKQEHSIAVLLPPRSLPAVQENPYKDLPVPPSPALPVITSQVAGAMTDSTPLPVLERLSEQEQLLAALTDDSTSAATGVLTDERVNELAKKKIQNANAVASRGSLYVARQELIEVMRMISQAKDAQQGTPERTTALAAGLRALREAADFAPRGTQLEAELDVSVLCASHRTPVAKQSDAAELLPALMMDRYLRYAQLQLALSVAGEPAGSMALHALGKLSSQLGRVEPEQNRLADRQAIAYQQAALLAHNQNHLAAHELGVLLAQAGHFAEAHRLLQQVASREPNAVVYRNLAIVEEKLGQPQLALSHRDRARELSQQGATGTNNIQWVSPAQFAQTGTPSAEYQLAQQQSPASPTGANQVVLPATRPGSRPGNRPVNHSMVR